MGNNQDLEKRGELENQLVKLIEQGIADEYKTKPIMHVIMESMSTKVLGTYIDKHPLTYDREMKRLYGKHNILSTFFFWVTLDEKYSYNALDILNFFYKIVQSIPTQELVGMLIGDEAGIFSGLYGKSALNELDNFWGYSQYFRYYIAGYNIIDILRNETEGLVTFYMNDILNHGDQRERSYCTNIVVKCTKDLIKQIEDFLVLAAKQEDYVEYYETSKKFQSEVIDFIKRNPIDPLMTDEDGYPISHLIVKTGVKEVVRAFIEKFDTSRGSACDAKKLLRMKNRKFAFLNAEYGDWNIFRSLITFINCNYYSCEWTDIFFLLVDCLMKGENHNTYNLVDYMLDERYLGISAYEIAYYELDACKRLPIDVITQNFRIGSIMVFFNAIIERRKEHFLSLEYFQRLKESRMAVEEMRLSGEFLIDHYTAAIKYHYENPKVLKSSKKNKK